MDELDLKKLETRVDELIKAVGRLQPDPPDDGADGFD